jgi:D-psicose/D-tagatose/L-ribulose 3-epimerase
MKFGVSTWLWTSPFTTESIKLFGKIKSMGFDVVEIPIEYPEHIDANKVRQALKDHELAAVVCGAFGSTRDLTHDDEEVQRNSFKYIEECLRMCVAWDADIFAGPIYSAVGKARMVSAEQRKVEWDRAVNNVRLVSDSAQALGLRIAVEPLNRFETDLINNVHDVVRLINDINHPSACIVLDGFHMTIEEMDIEQSIICAGDKLIHLQVSENHRGIPGTGLTPWESLSKGLQKIHYTGAISIESFTPEVTELAGAVCIWKKFADNQDDFARQGLAFLKKTLTL